MHELESVQVARQNYNDAEQIKRKSRTSKTQTRQTKDNVRIKDTVAVAKTSDSW